jgi:hypothetical protein
MDEGEKGADFLWLRVRCHLIRSVMIQVRLVLWPGGRYDFEKDLRSGPTPHSVPLRPAAMSGPLRLSTLVSGDHQRECCELRRRVPHPLRRYSHSNLVNISSGSSNGSKQYRRDVEPIDSSLVTMHYRLTSIETRIEKYQIRPAGHGVFNSLVTSPRSREQR